MYISAMSLVLLFICVVLVQRLQQLLPILCLDQFFVVGFANLQRNLNAFLKRIFAAHRPTRKNLQQKAYNVDCISSNLDAFCAHLISVGIS